MRKTLWRKAPWGKGYQTIPASCAELDLEAAGRALIDAGGDVGAAAGELGVPAHDFRLLTYAAPELIDAVLEAKERELDAAEAVLLEAMTAGDVRLRIRAASLYLRAKAPRSGRARAMAMGADLSPPFIKS
jgi:hypothetical protein